MREGCGADLRGYFLHGRAGRAELHCCLLARIRLSFYRGEELHLGVELLTLHLLLRSWGDEVRADSSAPASAHSNKPGLDVRADAWRTQGAPPREGASMG